MTEFLRSTTTGLLVDAWICLALLQCAVAPLAQDLAYPLFAPGLSAMHLVAVFGLGVCLTVVRALGPEWQQTGYPSILKEMSRGWVRVMWWVLLTTVVAPFWVLIGWNYEWPNILYWMFLANCLAVAVVGMRGNFVWNEILKERAAAA